MAVGWDGDLWPPRGRRRQRWQGPGTVIRSLPQRTDGCLESDRFAGWPLTACLSSGTGELWGIGKKLVVNIKCDILSFAYSERRKETEGIIIWGKNGHRLFPAEIISFFATLITPPWINRSWNSPHKTIFKSSWNLHSQHAESFDCCLNGLHGEWGHLHANSWAVQFSYHVCKWTHVQDQFRPNINSQQYADFMLTFHFIYSLGN